MFFFLLLLCLLYSLIYHTQCHKIYFCLFFMLMCILLVFVLQILFFCYIFKNAVLVELIRLREKEKVNNNNNKFRNTYKIQKNLYTYIQHIHLYLDIGSIFILYISIYHRRAITGFVWIEYLFFNPLSFFFFSSIQCITSMLS